MNKYGIEHFHISLIEETDYPNEREVYWIEKLGSFKHGYNATIGGDGKKYIDYDLVVATYKKIGKAIDVAKILNISVDSVLHILKERNVSVTHASIHTSLAVAQLDKNTSQILQVFPSIHAAERAIGIHGHIAQVCLGKRKTCGGYKWQYI